MRPVAEIRLRRAELTIVTAEVAGYDAAPPSPGPIHLSPEMEDLGRRLLADLENG